MRVFQLLRGSVILPIIQRLLHHLEQPRLVWSLANSGINRQLGRQRNTWQWIGSERGASGRIIRWMLHLAPAPDQQLVGLGLRRCDDQLTDSERQMGVVGPQLWSGRAHA